MPPRTRRTVRAAPATGAEHDGAAEQNDVQAASDSRENTPVTVMELVPSEPLGSGSAVAGRKRSRSVGEGSDGGDDAGASSSDESSSSEDDSDDDSDAAPSKPSTADVQRAALQRLALQFAAQTVAAPKPAALTSSTASTAPASAGRVDLRDSRTRAALSSIARATLGDQAAAVTLRAGVADKRQANRAAATGRLGHMAPTGDGAPGITHLFAANSSGSHQLVNLKAGTGIGAGVLTLSDTIRNLAREEEGGAAKSEDATATTSSGGSAAADAAMLLSSTAETALNKSLALSGNTGIAAPLLAPTHKVVKANDRPTAGGKWYDLPAQELTTELKRDLLILRNRAFLDPKRHYKTKEERAGDLPRYFAVGTVVEAPHEKFMSSARLTNKERKSSLVAALMADDDFQRYAKKNVQEVYGKATGGGIKAYQARKQGTAAPWKKRARLDAGGKSKGTRR